MIRLLQWLIFGHVHRWRVAREGGVTKPGQARPCGIWHEYECQTCGIRKYKQQTD